MFAGFFFKPMIRVNIYELLSSSIKYLTEIYILSNYLFNKLQYFDNSVAVFLCVIYLEET